MQEGLTEGRKVRLPAAYLFTFSICIYLLSIPAIYGGEFIQRYEVPKSIVERFDLSVPEGTPGVIKGMDGRFYSIYGLGWPMLAVPFYKAGKILCRYPENLVYLLNTLAGAATVIVVFLFSIALGYSRRSSLAVAIFYGLGTFAWPLAKHPFDHVVETLFVLLSVYFMYRQTSENTIIRLINSALCLGIAINTRLVSILALPALLVMMGAGCGAKYSLANNCKAYIRKMAVFMSVLLPFGLLVLWYNYYRFGSIFETGFQLYAARTGLDFFSGTPLLTGLRGFLTSPGKGFFYYSPIAVFFFYTIIPFIKKHRWAAISFVLLILSYLLFLSRNVYWHGDWAWGPRYLLAITPFIIIPITELLDSVPWRKKNPVIVLPLYLVFTLSILVQIMAISVRYDNYFYNLHFDQNVQFPLVQGSGLPGIAHPPPEIYFDWAKSPILAQWKDIKKIGSEIISYRYVELPQHATDREKVKAYPSMHLFDLWWVYMYFLGRSYKGFVVVVVLLIVVGICGHQIIKLTRRGSFPREDT